MDQEKIVIALGLPGSAWPWECIQSFLHASREWEFHPLPSWQVPHNFNNCWASALNLAESGEITHFAMLHQDTYPEAFWLDTLMREMRAAQLSLISVAIAIKDVRGLYSCGIGDPDNPQIPKRRWSIREADAELPPTWGAEEAGYPGEMLLHNNGCWLADLRDKRFFTTDEKGMLRAVFDFPTRIYRHDGLWVTDGESEDWYFSRQLWEIGLRNTKVTRTVRLNHEGKVQFPNFVTDHEHPALQWFKRDWHTEQKWNKNGSKESVSQPS